MSQGSKSFYTRLMLTDPHDTLARAQALLPKLSQWRRALHQQPELGFEEYETARLVARELQALGIEFSTGIGKTGIVADIHSGKPGKLIALRADMDALPIHEAESNDPAYRSQVAGKMHACGHDAHTAMLIGTAALFAQHPPTRGGVRLIFQPCEETQDANGDSGGKLMANEGAMRGVDAVLALHVTPMQAAGMVSYDPAISASVDNFECVLTGAGGHASMPHRTVDLSMVLGQVLTALYSLVPRHIDPMQAATLTVGSVHGGDTHNVIPAEYRLVGTLRTRSREARERALQAIEQVVVVARALGAGCHWRWLPGALPVALNDEAMLGTMLASAKAMLGVGCVGGADELGLGGEDFSFLANLAPAAMLYLGTKMPHGEHGDWHTPTFDIDENAMPIGAAIMYDSVVRLLG